MAFTLKLTHVALALLFCSVVMLANSDCVTGYGCYYVEVGMQNRKLLSEKEVATVGLVGSSAMKAQDLEGSELRMVPSGPDPLHHNANPKKPRTP